MSRRYYSQSFPPDIAQKLFCFRSNARIHACMHARPTGLSNCGRLCLFFFWLNFPLLRLLLYKVGGCRSHFTLSLQSKNARHTTHAAFVAFSFPMVPAFNDSCTWWGFIKANLHRFVRCMTKHCLKAGFFEIDSLWDSAKAEQTAGISLSPWRGWEWRYLFHANINSRSSASKKVFSFNRSLTSRCVMEKLSSSIYLLKK